jgi:hypothetical protein
MKKNDKTTLLFSFVFLFLFFSCETIPDKNDECDATKMIEPQSPVVYLKLFLEYDTLPGQSHYLYKATRAVFSGTITKIYCSGKVSTTFSFSPVYFLSEMDPYYIYNGFYLDQPYQFNFDNDLDYLLIRAHIKAYFNDGKIYESDEMLKKNYYKDLKYDVDQMKKYLKLLMPYPMHWTEVTSK